MITDAIRTNPDLPLRWLIFSRPEAHLKNAFSTNTECGRDELVIDAECRENVEQYVNAELLKVRTTYKDVTPTSWLSQANLREILGTIDGLFILAWTRVNFIGDRDEADPVSQLDSLLTFIHRIENVMGKNPLATLDLLCLRILTDVPPPIFEITTRISGYLSLRDPTENILHSVQALSNFLRLDRRTFNKAIRGLYSVMWIPDPEEAFFFSYNFTMPRPTTFSLTATVPASLLLIYKNCL